MFGWEVQKHLIHYSQWPGNNLKETRLMVSSAKSWSVLLGFVWIDLVLRLVMVNPGWERKSRTFLSWACLSNTTFPLRGNYESSCFPGLDEISPKTIPLSKLLFHVHQVIFWLFYFPGTSLSEKTVLWIWVTGIRRTYPLLQCVVNEDIRIWVYKCLLSPCLFNLYAEHIMRCWAGCVTSWNQDR